MNFNLGKRLIVLGLTQLLWLGGCNNGPGENPTFPATSPTASSSASSAESGEPSPGFNLAAPDGSTVEFNPKENPDNEVFLLLFWSYRFDPNVKTLLSRAGELHERYSPRGLNIIGVAYGEEPSGLRKFLAANPVPFEVAVGADSTYEKFALTSIPTAVLVDENGRIVERWSGYFTTEELAEKISPKLPGRTGNSEE